MYNRGYFFSNRTTKLSLAYLLRSPTILRNCRSETRPFSNKAGTLLHRNSSLLNTQRVICSPGASVGYLSVRLSHITTAPNSHDPIFLATETFSWSKILATTVIGVLTVGSLHYWLHLEEEEPLNSKNLTPMEELASDNNRVAVQDKSVHELIRSLAVYKLCSFSTLVSNASSLIAWAEKLHLARPTYWIVRKSFFAQFCGGETPEECISLMNKLKEHGISSILDFSIEADLNNEGFETDSDSFRKRCNEQADHVTDSNIQCLQTAASQPNSFIAIKLTGLLNPLVLQRLSNLLHSLLETFHNHDTDGDGKLTRPELAHLLNELPSGINNVADKLLLKADSDQYGKIDWMNFIKLVALEDADARKFFLRNYPNLTMADFEDYDKMMDRLNKICKSASEKNVRLMIDAEQSHFQHAIDYVAIKLSAKFNNYNNSHGPIIFNTYQMYLKDSLDRLAKHYEFSRKHNYVFALKLVRGAYMVSERKRAASEGYTDPIHSTLEDTHASYNSGVEFLLQKQSDAQKVAGKPLDISTSPVVFVIASHNRDSVAQAGLKMDRLGIQPGTGLVVFAQLLGMSDQISYTLGQHGYQVYKYIPYGKISDVVPYLIRRAQENSSILSGGNAVNERRLLWTEVIGRLRHTRSVPRINSDSIRHAAN